MRNAKKELEYLLEGKAKVKCAKITKGYQYNDEDQSPEYVLKINHSKQDFNVFLKSLDFEYYSGYGIQVLYGTIWLEDGSWCTRGGINGSEWWDHNFIPDIPAKCL